MTEAAIGVIAFVLGCLMCRRSSRPRLVTYPGSDVRDKLQAALSSEADVLLSPDEARAVLKEMGRS